MEEAPENGKELCRIPHMPVEWMNICGHEIHVSEVYWNAYFKITATCNIKKNVTFFYLPLVRYFRPYKLRHSQSSPPSPLPTFHSAALSCM